MSATELTSYPTAGNSFDRYYDPKPTTHGLINGTTTSSNYDYSCNQSPVRDCLNGTQNSADDNKTSCPIPADECWLFKPPSLQSKTSDVSQPISIWLRETFESPNSCFYRSRRNLSARLEAILISGGQTVAYRHSGSVPSLNSLSPSQTTNNLNQTDGSDFRPMTSRSLAYAPSTGSTDSISLSGFRTEQPNANYATFTRMKRTKPNTASLQHPPIPPSSSGNRGSTSHLSSSMGVNPFSSSSRPANKTGSCDELERTTLNADVQEIARMQEDHLKAEVAALVAASTAGRHGSQHSISSLNRLSPDGSCTNIASAPESPHSSTTRLVPNYQLTSGGGSAYESQQSSSLGLRHTTNSTYGLHSIESINQPFIPPYAPQYDLSQPQINHGLNGSSNSMYPKPNPYKLLPQKPVFNTTSMDSLGPDQINYASYPIQTSTISGLQPNEVRNHFGFRASRKNSNPQPPPPPPYHLPRPACPTTPMLRRGFENVPRFDSAI